MLLGLLLILPGAVLAADDSFFDAIYMERLGLMSPRTYGARDTGLGGTGVAWCEDVQSLVINPAGLAAITRLETHVGFRQSANLTGISYFGDYSEFKPTRTALDAIALAYPLPTLRGSLVFAGGVFRYRNTLTEALWSGTNSYDGDRERSSFLLEGGLYGWVGGFALALSAQTDAGLSFEIINGELDVINRFEYGLPAGALVYRDTYEDVLSITGWRVHLGLQTRPWRGASLGVKVTTPTRLTSSGESAYLAQDIESGVVTWESDEFSRSEEEISLPYRVALGFAQGYGPVRLSFALEHVGWEQTTVDGQRLLGEDLQGYLESALNKRIGLEVAPPNLPVRFYTGFALLPSPLKLLDSGEYDTEGYVIPKTIEEVEERKLLSAGVGLFLSETLLCEVGYAREIHERRTPVESYGTSDVTQKSENNSLVMSFSYRF